MNDDLVFELTGRSFVRQHATLHGYRKIQSELGYPSIVPDPNGQVEGCVLLDVGTEALKAFDMYEEEGRLYQRTSASVAVDGRQEHCLVYVGLPPF